VVRVRWFVLVTAVIALVAAEPVSPESVCREAVAHLRSLPEDDRYATRFLSYHTLPPDEVPTFRRLMRWWVRQLTLKTGRYSLTPVNPHLDAVDLRSVGWKAVAWKRVAVQDVVFREPLVSHPTAVELLDLTGHTPADNFAVVAVVSAHRLYRLTYETDLSPAYYDLLYSEQRFVRNETTGKHDFKDFPKDFDDWLTAFGADRVVSATGKKVAVEIRHGAVVPGILDNEPGSSYVARHKRLVWVAPTVPTGTLSQTFDVAASADEKDFSENPATDGKRDVENLKFDAGEALIDLPGGGQAPLLFNNQFKRVEFADPKLAVHSLDPHDRTVKLPGSCIACHAKHDGLIPLHNEVEDDLRNGIDVKSKSAEDRDAFAGFFLDWDFQLNASRTRYKRLAATYGLTGPKLATETMRYRNLYDAPVTVEVAARELGLDPVAFRLRVSKSVSRNLLTLLQRRTVPRAAWDAKAVRDAVNLVTSPDDKVLLNAK
jgi:hypothetical protein